MGHEAFSKGAPTLSQGPLRYVSTTTSTLLCWGQVTYAEATRCLSFLSTIACGSPSMKQCLSLFSSLSYSLLIAQVTAEHGTAECPIASLHFALAALSGEGLVCLSLASSVSVCSLSSGWFLCLSHDVLAAVLSQQTLARGSGLEITKWLSRQGSAQHESSPLFCNSCRPSCSRRSSHPSSTWGSRLCCLSSPRDAQRGLLW